MFALISPNEPVYLPSQPEVVQGVRVAQIEAATFEVAPPLFWVECTDTITTTDYVYDMSSSTFVLIDIEVVPTLPVTTL